MRNRNPAVCRQFVELAKLALKTRPELIHSWSIDADEDHCVLQIPARSPEGFPITVDVNPEEITVFAGGFHQHFTCVKPYESQIRNVLGVVRDFLSPIMRIRELLAGGSAYRWDAEMLIDGEWKPDGTTGLLFWNYFGKRSERFLQNDHLPPRSYDREDDKMGEPGATDKPTISEASHNLGGEGEGR